MFSLKPLIADAAELPVDLRTADSFGVLAGQGVTNTLTGFTIIDGDLGDISERDGDELPTGGRERGDAPGGR